jgi:hypothetical protein
VIAQLLKGRQYFASGGIAEPPQRANTRRAGGPGAMPGYEPTMPAKEPTVSTKKPTIPDKKSPQSQQKRNRAVGPVSKASVEMRLHRGPARLARRLMRAWFTSA